MPTGGQEKSPPLTEPSTCGALRPETVVMRTISDRPEDVYMKSVRERMDITAAYREVGTYRGCRDLSDHPQDRPPRCRSR